MKRAGRPHERSRDDSSDTHRRDELERNLADPIELADRDDVLVRSDLKHAVGRRVDDRPAGPDVFGAKPIDDLGAGGHHIPERPASDPIFEDFDRLCRKPVGKCRETAR